MKKYKKKCIVCDKIFQAKRSHAKTCGDYCRNMLSLSIRVGNVLKEVELTNKEIAQMILANRDKSPVINRTTTGK